MRINLKVYKHPSNRYSIKLTLEHQIYGVVRCFAPKLLWTYPRFLESLNISERAEIFYSKPSSDETQQKDQTTLKEYEETLDRFQDISEKMFTAITIGIGRNNSDENWTQKNITIPNLTSRELYKNIEKIQSFILRQILRVDIYVDRTIRNKTYLSLSLEIQEALKNIASESDIKHSLLIYTSPELIERFLSFENEILYPDRAPRTYFTQTRFSKGTETKVIIPYYHRKNDFVLFKVQHIETSSVANPTTVTASTPASVATISSGATTPQDAKATDSKNFGVDELRELTSKSLFELSNS